MKQLILLILVLFITLFSIAQAPPMPYRVCDKWGFVKYGTKEFIIPPQYDDVGRFSEGRAWVKKDCLYGYIDLTGALVIPLVYEVAGNFSYPYSLEYIGNQSFFTISAFVQKNGKEYHINLKEEEVKVEPTWICGNGIDRQRPPFHAYKEGKKYGLALEDYNDTHYPRKDIPQTPALYDQIIPTMIGYFAQKDGKWGIINGENEIIKDFIWDKIQLFEDEYTFIKEVYDLTCFGVCQDNKWAIADGNREVITPYKYQAIKARFEEHQFIAQVQTFDNTWGFIDMQGNEYFEDCK